MSAPQFRDTPNPPMSAPPRRRHVFAYSPTTCIRRRKKTITFFSVTRPNHGHSPQNRRSRQKTTTFLCDSAPPFLCNGGRHSISSILLQSPFMYSRHAFPPHINQTRHIFLFLTKVFLFLCPCDEMRPNFPRKNHEKDLSLMLVIRERITIPQQRRLRSRH